MNNKIFLYFNINVEVQLMQLCLQVNEYTISTFYGGGKYIFACMHQQYYINVFNQEKNLGDVSPH
jgi:hypothetical protein